MWALWRRTRTSAGGARPWWGRARRDGAGDPAAGRTEAGVERPAAGNPERQHHPAGDPDGADPPHRGRGDDPEAGQADVDELPRGAGARRRPVRRRRPDGRDRPGAADLVDLPPPQGVRHDPRAQPALQAPGQADFRLPRAAPHLPVTRPRPSRWALKASGAGLAVVVLDQVSKWEIQRTFLIGEGRWIVDGFFKLVYVRNPGVAFGLLADVAWRW